MENLNRIMVKAYKRARQPHGDKDAVFLVRQAYNIYVKGEKNGKKIYNCIPL